MKLFDRLQLLGRLDGPPQRIAAALALGVFISCTPLYGVQTVLALLLAALFRLNKTATVLGTWLNLPWFAPFVYGAGLKVGARVLAEVRDQEAESLAILFGQPLHLSLDNLAAVLPDLSLALVIGTTLVGLVAAGVTYLVAFGVMRRRRAGARRPT